LSVSPPSSSNPIFQLYFLLAMEMITAVPMADYTGAHMFPNPEVHIGNSKQVLITFMQKHVGRSLVKADLDYAVETVGESQFQCTLTINCLNHERYQGHICPTGPAAQQAAALLAIEAHAAEIAAIPACDASKPTKKDKKAMAQAKARELGGELPGDQMRRDAYGTPQLRAQRGGKSGGGKGQGNHWKNELMQTVQGAIQRMARRGDIEYTYNRKMGLSQCTVILHCLGGSAYNGEPCRGDQDAEQSAARHALQSGEPWVFAAPLQQAGAPITGAFGKGGNPSVVVAPNLHTESNSKQNLHQLLQSMIKRSLVKGDLVYEVTEHKPEQGTLFQAVVTLNCTGGASFAGEPKETAKAAEQAAAFQALESFEPAVRAEHMTSKSQPKRPAGGAEPANKRQRMDGQMSGDMMMGGGGVNAIPLGKKAGGPRMAPPPCGVRTAVTSEQICGAVLEWHPSGWGYVQAEQPVDHPMYMNDGGKIVARCEDLLNTTSLESGQMIFFAVYADEKRLGASDIFACQGMAS